MKRLMSLAVAGVFATFMFSSCIKHYECEYENELSSGKMEYKGNSKQEFNDWKKQCETLGGTYKNLK